MLTYCLLNKDDILNVMSSKSIELNLGNHILYTKLPCCNQGELIFQLYLTHNKKGNLIRISKYEYLLNESIQLESTKFRLLYQNEEQKQFIKNMILLYKEIKFDENEENKIILNRLECSDIDVKSFKLDKEDILYKYEYKKNVRVDRIKGMIYGLVSTSYFNLRDIINDNTPYYNEKKSIDAMMVSLRENKFLDRELYNKLLALKNELSRKIIETLKSTDKNQFLFSFNEFKKIIFNNNYLKITQLEKELYELLINKIINYNGDYYGKDILHKVTLEMINIIESSSIFSEIQNDVLLLKRRILYNDYIVDVDDIKSNLIKNIYAVYIKFNNIKELYSYINNKNINRSYIAFSIFGACQGFRDMPYSTIIDVNKNNLALDIVKASIDNVYNNFYSLRYNVHYTREKINLCINNISLQRKEVRNFNLKDVKVKVQEINSKYIINLNKPILGTMNIYIYNRKPKMANTIKYYDSKIKKLSSKYKSFEYDKDVYFTYAFLNDSEYKISNLQKEYYFSVVLKEVYDYIKGGYNCE